MADNLVRRGNNFSIRLFIPSDLQGIIGKREIVRSLKTRDKRQAIVVLRKLQEGTQSLFFMVRMGMVDRGQLTAILMNYIDNELSSFQSSGGSLLPHEDDTLYETSASKYLTEADCYGGLSLSGQFRKFADGVRKDFYVKKNKAFVGDFAKSVLDENGITLDAESPDFTKFREDFAYVYILAINELANRAEGIKSFDYQEKVRLHVEEATPVTLKEAIE